MLRSLTSAKPFSTDFGLLILRLGSGLALLTHGWPKLVGFTDRMNSFADPFGIGSAPSLALAVFSEVVCSILIALGLFTRLASIPLIITMVTIVFLIHGDDPFGKRELPILYLASFLIIFFTGPGRFSVDGMRGK